MGEGEREGREKVSLDCRLGRQSTSYFLVIQVDRSKCLTANEECVDSRECGRTLGTLSVCVRTKLEVTRQTVASELAVEEFTTLTTRLYCSHDPLGD